MIIIEITELHNGGHNNQTINGADPATFHVPDGWAVIPDGMETENFPFGEITVEDGIVTSWTPGTIPEPEPEPEPEPTLDERVTALETTKANQTDVDELNEALNIILTGYTGEEAADETGA